MENLQNVVIKKHKCNLCEYRSDRTPNIRRHKKLVHGDMKHQASPSVSVPIGYKQVQTQTNPLQVGNPYLTRDVGTQYPER